MGDIGSGEWSSDDVARHLRSSAIFQQLDDEALERFVAAATVELVPAGDLLITEGDAGSDAFVVIAGRL